MSPVQPSRTEKDLRTVEAEQFAYLAKRDLEAALSMTAGWSRRQLLDVALTLALSRAEPNQMTREEALGPSPYRSVLRTVGPRREPLEIAWTDDNLRAAHKAFEQGHRSPWSVEGERLYSRISKRRRRAS